MTHQKNAEQKPPKTSFLGFGYEAFIAVRYLMAKRQMNLQEELDVSKKSRFSTLAVMARYLLRKLVGVDVVSVITIISVLGVAVGVMAMIVVLSVMGGFEGDLKTKILGTKTHIVVKSDDSAENLKNSKVVLDAISKLPDVIGSARFVESEVMISSPTNLSGVLIKGIDPGRIGQVSDLERNLIDGDITYLEKSEKIRPGRRGLSDPEELDRILDELELEHGLADPSDGKGRYVPGIEGKVYPSKDGREVIDQGAKNADFRRKFVFDDTAKSVGDPAPKPTKQTNSDDDPSDVATLYKDNPDIGFMPPLPGQTAPKKAADPNDDPSDVATLYRDDPDIGFMPPLPGQTAPKKSAWSVPSISANTPVTKTRTPGIIIGRELKKTLQVDIGSEVNVVSPDGDIGPSGVIPRSRPFKVVGVFYSGMYEYDTKYVYMSLPDIQNFLNIPEDEVTGIEVKSHDIDAITVLKAEMEKNLAASGLMNGVEIRDWKDMNSNLFFALKLEKIVMSLILVFIILVASFSIVCNLVMVVIEKGREIAILKGMGATDFGVMKIFIMEGTIIGSVGTLIGLILGVVCCLIVEFYGIRLDPDVYYINTLPVEMDIGEIVLIAISGVVISALATLYPSKLAARLTPVDGLRYD